MPIFLRILSAANSVREWFSFANEAVSLLGITKRVAAAGLVAAAVAAPVIAQKPAPTAQQLKEAHAAVNPDQVAAGDLGECAGGGCSTLYLVENEQRIELARRIVRACETTTTVPLAQCEAAAKAVGAFEAVMRHEKREAAFRKAQEEAPPVGRLPLGHIGK